MARETKTSICGICPGGCGVKKVLADGKVEKISPIKGHPVGVVCIRGLHSKEIVYSRDRLKYPLLRKGQKGEGNFERITWDEAVDRIVHAFRKTKDGYGAQAVMSYFGRGSFESNLLDVFGAPDPAGQGVSGFLSLRLAQRCGRFFGVRRVVQSPRRNTDHRGIDAFSLPGF